MKDYGAVIEMGVILTAENTGTEEEPDYRYTVKSETTSPVKTPPIGCITDVELTAGDRVYFFMFEDGNGKILGKM